MRDRYRIVHKILKVIAFLPIYISIMVTLTFYVIIFGVPFVGGK